MKPILDMRNDSTEDVVDMQRRVKNIRAQKAKYKALSQLLDGKTIDLRDSSILFEALNRERMEFEEILKLHPDQAQDCIDQTKDDIEAGRNLESKAKWAVHYNIPLCIYYSRPKEYWQDKKMIENFLRMFPKFRVTK